MTPDPQELVTLIREVIKNKGLYAVNEQKTKNGVVHPLLACLGWNPYNVKEVDPEYAVESGRVDYCLKRGEVAAVFIEVKRLDEPLVKHQEQLLRYAFDKSVTLAALTDGVRWWFYLPTQPDSSWEQRRFFTIDLEQQDSQEAASHFRKYLGKQEVLSGSALRAAQELHAGHTKERAIREAIPIAWRELCEEPDSQLVELLSEKVEGRCGYRPDPEDLGEFIVGRLESANSTSASTPSMRTKNRGRETAPSELNTTRPEPKTPKAEKREPVISKRDDRQWTSQKAVSYTFLGTKHSVTKFKEILIGLAVILHKKDPAQFWPKVEQLVSNRGKAYYTKELDRLQTPGRIGQTGIWVETCLSANAVKERCYELIEAFGYSEDDLRVELRPRDA